MNRKLLALGVLLAVLLVAAAIVLTTAHYSGPRGAATGGAAGCGGDPVADDVWADDPDVGEQDPAEAAAAPAQVIYRQFTDGKLCRVVTIEPVDRVATVDELCQAGQQPLVLDLDESQAQEVLTAYHQLADRECEEEECPAGSRVEILTLDEASFFLPYESPLREPVENLLAQAEAEEEPAMQVRQVVLRPEEGAVFANGTVVPNASPLKVDLICYASSKSVDLQAGAGPTMAKQKHLRLFRTPGGTVASFDSLAAVPDEAPGADDRDMVHHAKAGQGFVVENNLSSGYARLRVVAADDDAVTLEYVTVP